LAKSSQNRRWHGLCGAFVVLACEKQDAFNHLFASFLADEKPVGSVEEELVRKMAEYSWMRQRTHYMMNCCFEMKERAPEHEGTDIHDLRVHFPRLDTMIRYQAHFDRCYAKASNELLRRRKERELRENRFESQRRAQAEEKRRMRREERGEEKHNLYVMRQKLDLQARQKRLEVDSGSPNQAQAA
jgi:hypothetical protein